MALKRKGKDARVGVTILNWYFSNNSDSNSVEKSQLGILTYESILSR